jgi:hypothetical protein
LYRLLLKHWREKEEDRRKKKDVERREDVKTLENRRLMAEDGRQMAEKIF